MASHRIPSKRVYTKTVDFSSTSVGTAAWVLLDANITNNISFLRFVNEVGARFSLGVGAAGSEVEVIQIDGSENPTFSPCPLSSATKLSIKALTTDGTDPIVSGILVIEGWA